MNVQLVEFCITGSEAEQKKAAQSDQGATSIFIIQMIRLMQTLYFRESQWVDADEHSIICHVHQAGRLRMNSFYSKVTQDKENVCKTCLMGALFVIFFKNQKRKKKTRKKENICSVK